MHAHARGHLVHTCKRAHQRPQAHTLRAMFLFAQRAKLESRQKPMRSVLVSTSPSALSDHCGSLIVWGGNRWEGFKRIHVPKSMALPGAVGRLSF